MLEKVSNVKISGGYFETEADFPLFAKSLNMLYGRNGSGKSTISRAIREYVNWKEDEEEKHKFTLSFDAPVDRGSIFVFNEDFVRDKVLVDKDGVGTIVMLGNQVLVDKQIEIEKEKLNKLQGQRDSLKQIEEDYNNKKNKISSLYYFSLLREQLKEWASYDAKIRNPSAKINSKINECLIGELCSYSTRVASSDTESNLRDGIEDKYNLYSQTENAVPLLWIVEKFELPICLADIQKLLNEHVEKPELSKRDRIIIDIAKGKYVKYINEAATVFDDVDLDVCPLCQRALSNEEKRELQLRIKAYFNREADLYKARLSNLLGYFDDLEPVLPTFLGGLYSDLLGSAFEAVGALNKILKNIRTIIQQKLFNVFTEKTFDLSNLGIEKTIKKYNDCMSLLAKKVDEYNLAIDNHNALRKELLLLNKKLAYIRNKELLKQYNQAVKNQATNSKELDKNKEDIKGAKKKILELEQSKRQVKIALEFINKSLKYVFYDNDRLILEQGDGCYRLKSRGHDVLPKDVSVGERNIIGLCYFFASLFEGKEDERKYDNELMLIIDDPISSFDFENKVGVISFLRWQLDKIFKGNINSKVLLLTHDLQVFMDLEKLFQDKANKKNISYLYLDQKKIQKLNDGKIAHEYNNLLFTVYNFALNDTALDENYSIGNTMRRVLEAFFSFNYSENFTNIRKLDELLAHLDTKEYFKNSMMRLVLHGESHYEERTKTLTTPFDFFSTSEKHRTARDILCLLFNLSSAHIKAILGEDALHEIKRWNDSIIAIE